ncbi:MAG: beta-ketoacyl synthase chain length factor [Verrucomicrobiaceae bacterium]|nr:beta-ketoacyl synthase chain length factor [Verrucomicrobiaceae bacterium]
MNLHALDLTIEGLGVVSPAGWGLPHLKTACNLGMPLPTQELLRTSGQARSWSCSVRSVPSPPADYLPRSPRLRRASPLTKFLLGATIEALNGHTTEGLGIIQVMQNGAVQYSGRFFHELLTTPSTPSPLIFPETVFNAPTSHVASCIAVSGAVTTLIGEDNLLIEALQTASQWLEEGCVERVLVLAGEELDWLSTEAATYYNRNLVASEGAGALLLAKGRSGGPRIRFTTGLHGHTGSRRRTVIQKVADCLTEDTTSSCALVTSESGIARLDRAESQAWSEAKWQHFSPKVVLGHSMGASCAIQAVLAASLLDQYEKVVVSCPGEVASGGLIFSRL